MFNNYVCYKSLGLSCVFHFNNFLDAKSKMISSLRTYIFFYLSSQGYSLHSESPCFHTSAIQNVMSPKVCQNLA